MKNALMLLCASFLMVACGEQPKKESASEVKQPFSLSDDVQTKENVSDIKQPFSLSDDVQTKSK